MVTIFHHVKGVNLKQCIEINPASLDYYLTHLFSYLYVKMEISLVRNLTKHMESVRE